MPLAYSYVRFSKAEQKKGDSLRCQLDLSGKFAREHGLTLVQNYSELGDSAYHSKNRNTGALG